MILIEVNGKGPTSKTSIIKAKEIQFDLSRADIALREPTIISSGITYFRDFYAYGELYNQIPAVGQNITVDGENSFEINYSDEFLVASSPSFKGKLLSGQLAYPYDELGSLSSIFTFAYAKHLIILIILLVIIYFFLVDKKGSLRGNRLENG
jgi:hypothetical protein